MAFPHYELLKLDQIHGNDGGRGLNSQLAEIFSTGLIQITDKVGTGEHLVHGSE